MSSHWASAVFGDFAHLEKGISYKSSDLCEEGEGLPFINLKSIDRGGGYRPDGLKWYSGKFKNSQVVEPGDLILCCTDLTKQKAILGYPILVPDIGYSKFCISLDLAKIVVDESRILKSFLFLLLQDRKMREFMQSRSSGTTVMHLKTSEVPSVEVELPPMVEQKRIVDLISSLDSYIESLDTQSMKATITRNAVLNELIAQGVADWNSYKFEEIATATKGKLPRGKNEVGEGIPYLTASFLRTNKADFWIQNTDGAVMADDGDCLILWDGAGAGDLFTAQNGVVSSTMAVVKAKRPDITKEFLTLYISSKSSYIKETCRGTTVPHVSPDAINNMEVFIPSISEQNRIVDLMSDMDETFDKLQFAHKAAKKLRTGLLFDLLTGNHAIPSTYDKFLGATP
jgi:restriction endonuclease S subunit